MSEVSSVLLITSLLPISWDVPPAPFQYCPLKPFTFWRPTRSLPTTECFLLPAELSPVTAACSMLPPVPELSMSMSMSPSDLLSKSTIVFSPPFTYNGSLPSLQSLPLDPPVFIISFNVSVNSAQVRAAIFQDCIPP